ncbi:MAG TPA: aspartate carbamoyltransferase catalytic subunit [Ignavibacteria bacterium]|nr:aspartate carbamoyltransferase catalytic subunit [Ignavibacteria bacterium]
MNFPKHLTGLKDLNKDVMENIFSLTAEYKKKILVRDKSYPDLKNFTVLNLFFENSTRTRVSFELAEKLLNMKVVNFNADVSSLSKGESILDTVRNLEAMRFDFIVSRSTEINFPEFLIKHTTSQIMNAGDGTNEHPTQGLLDIFTIKENFKDLKDLKVCIVGDISHSRVAMSNIYGLQNYAAKVSVCAPDYFLPKDLKLNVYDNFDDAIKENDVLIMLRIQNERGAGEMIKSLDDYKKLYGLNKKRVEQNKNILLLHPGPWNTGVEVEEDVLDLPNTKFFEQVTNGLAIKLALFTLMTK